MKQTLLKWFITPVFALIPMLAWGASPSSYSIMAGHPSNYTDSYGTPWSADSFYKGGQAFVRNDTILNATDGYVYQGERYSMSGSFSYNLPLAAGTYKIILKFSESYFTTAGARQFNVSVNGVRILTNFDIFKESGGKNTAIDKTAQFTIASDKTVPVVFSFGAAGQPSVDAIAIRQISPPLPTYTISQPSNATPFSGIGVHIWPGDSAGSSVANDLSVSWVRGSVGPNWLSITSNCGNSSSSGCPPIGQGLAAYQSWIASVFNADCSGSACRTGAFPSLLSLKNKGVKWVEVLFQLPLPLITANNSSSFTLNGNLLGDVGWFYAALLDYLHSNNVYPDAVELFNEPNGDWDAQVPTWAYPTIVNLITQDLASLGLAPPQIIGPGTSWIQSSAQFLNALTPSSIKQLGGWSVHAWDPPAQVLGALTSWLAEVNAIAPKPTFVTEFGLPNNQDRGTVSYANQLNTFLLQVLQQKVSVPILWEAADQSWEQSMWGLADSSGNLYPAGSLLKSYLSYLKLGNASYLNVNAPAGISNVESFAIQGKLSSQDSVVVLFWNSGTATQTFSVSPPLGKFLKESVNISLSNSMASSGNTVVLAPNQGLVLVY